MPGPEERVVEQPQRPRESDTRWEPRVPREDLLARLERLPRGHPSSPFHDDATRKPPPPDYRRAELPLPDDQNLRNLPGEKLRIEPLTDEKYAEHVEEVRVRLADARSNGLATDEQFTLDPDGELWSRERRLAQNAIIEDIYSEASSVPNERQAIIAGGLPGSGKTTVLGSYVEIDRTRFLIIDPDRIKEEMARRGLVPRIEGLSPLEAADLVHAESSYIANRLAHKAQLDGKNLIWDITMSKENTTARRIENLRKAGYAHVDGIFIAIPVDISVERAANRHRAGHEEYRNGNGYGGRYVPEELIVRQTDETWGSVNRRTFEALKSRFDRWSIYDNTTTRRAPLLVETSDREKVRS